MHSFDFAVSLLQLIIPSAYVLRHLFLDLQNTVVNGSSFLLKFFAAAQKLIVFFFDPTHRRQRVLGAFKLDRKCHNFFIAGKFNGLFTRSLAVHVLAEGGKHARSRGRSARSVLLPLGLGIEIHDNRFSRFNGALVLAGNGRASHDTVAGAVEGAASLEQLLEGLLRHSKCIRYL